MHAIRAKHRYASSSSLKIRPLFSLSSDDLDRSGQGPRSLTSQGLNDVHGRYRARARPKVLHARTYEEALELMDRYEEFLLGLITDMRFPREGRLDANAGWKLVDRVRERNPDLPILIQSVETEHSQHAEEVGVAFVDKQAHSF